MKMSVHLNARADDCSYEVAERGQRIIRYQGDGYVIVGFFFARGGNGQRDLCYILRPVQDPPARESAGRGAP